jgi:hypothetical protein
MKQLLSNWWLGVGTFVPSAVALVAAELRNLGGHPRWPRRGSAGRIAGCAAVLVFGATVLARFAVLR